MMARIPSGASVIPEARIRTTRPGKNMPPCTRPARLIRKSAIAMLASMSLAVVGLCAFQFGDEHGLNNMPFAQVEPLASDLARAESMARQGNIQLLAGQAVPGRNVRLRGELTDANC